jgi:predicted PurR-regulated permease PerM
VDKDIVISVKTVIFLGLALAGGYVIYRLAPIFTLLLLATLLVLALEPLVGWFMKQKVFDKHINRSVSVILTYILFVLTVAIVFTVGLPPVITEGQKLYSSLGTLLSSLGFQTNGEFTISNLLPQLSNVSSGVVDFVRSGFSTATTLVSLIMISIYMSLDWQNLKRRFVELFRDKDKLEVLRTVEEIEHNVGEWVKGQLFLMLTIGLISFVGLVLLRVQYPLALGLIAAVLEAVPILGPIITAVLASVIAFADAPLKGVAVLAMFVIIQQLENNILVPKVMQRVSGFSPLVILIALLVGSTFFGFVGAIITVPLTMVGAVIAKTILRHTRGEKPKKK